jgi:cytochrome c
MMSRVFLTFLVLATTTLLAADGEAIYKTKCFSCHGTKAAKAALNKSKIIAGWDSSKIVQSLVDYKNGKGGVMKAVMKPIVSKLSGEEMKAVADTISSYK